MDTFVLMVLCFAAYLVAYHTYGKFLARKIFKLDPNKVVPSKELSDGFDYIPSKKIVIFGHHFASIAGTGPIVGPAIGVIWGWLPAILWIVFGSIFMGAVHDLGTLVVSLRNEGKSISDITARYVNRRVRFIFFAIVFFVLLIVLAVFGVTIAVVFARFPSSVLAVWLQIPIAVAAGWAIYKKGVNIPLVTVLAVVAMYTTIWLGSIFKFTMPIIGTMPPTGSWTILLMVYCFFASTLPVNILLQPRDYINAWQLFIMMALLGISAVIASLTMNMSLVAPAVNHNLTDAPPMMPFLFITIACGAISGFHALVASGTSPKQLEKEPDALFVGYGSMLIEGVLAVLVIVCVAAGIGLGYKTADGVTLLGADAWLKHYSSWSSAEGLMANIAAVVVGAANIMAALKIPQALGIAVMGVFIASFAGTTLDTTARLQRYIIGELAVTLKLPKLTNRYTATFLAVATAAALAFATGADGKGAIKLWPLFGAVNQLLAALALLVVTMYLKQKGGMKFLFTLIPCVLMLVITIWALVLKLSDFIHHKNCLLTGIGLIVLILSVWMVLETAILFFKKTAHSEIITD